MRASELLKEASALGAFALLWKQGWSRLVSEGSEPAVFRFKGSRRADTNWVWWKES